METIVIGAAALIPIILLIVVVSLGHHAAARRTGPGWGRSAPVLDDAEQIVEAAAHRIRDEGDGDGRGR